MALFKSALISQASGSIGGMTLSHAKGGMYIRARAIPVNTNTPYQQQIRAAMTAAVTAWRDLTPAEQEAWNLYGTNTATTNALGDTIFLSGQNWFIAANTPLLQLNAKFAQTEPLITDAPSVFDRGSFTTPSIVTDVSSGTLVTYTNTDAWAGEDGSWMLIYQGKPLNAARRYFNGPWRLLGAIQGDGTPPTPPLTVPPAGVAANGWPYVVGQKVCYAVAVLRIDGRISTRRIVDTLAIA